MDTTGKVYDVIIIGAGVEGSATAYYLTSRYTKNVLLLEQFTAIHTRGSSCGSSRVTRRAYGHSPLYTKLMEHAYRMWSEIENKSGKKLYTKTGMLVFGDETINPYITSLQVNNIPHTVMNGTEVNSMYPDQLRLPEECICAFDSEAGILSASEAVSALQYLYISNGGRLLDRHQVKRIVPEDHGAGVMVETNKGCFHSTRVIVTAGPWTNKLLATTELQLPLTPIRTEVFYWSVDSDEKLFSSDSFPVTYSSSNDGNKFYSIPIHEYPGLMKLCPLIQYSIVYHDGISIDPDKRDSEPGFRSTKMVSDFIVKYFKGISHSSPAVSEVCIYTMTPDKDPFLDRHPKYSNIIIGAGFSGHGFKLAPVVGQILSELALNVPSTYDLTPFKITGSRLVKSSL